MRPYDHWESFNNEDEDYDPMMDDQAFDKDFDEEIRNRLGNFKKRKLTGNELFTELSKFIGMFQALNRTDQDSWYARFCAAMERGDRKYYVEVQDIDILEAAQEVATEGPNGDSYKEWLQEFGYRDEPDNYSEIEFFRVLDTMGFFKDKLDLIDNPQDILDL